MRSGAVLPQVPFRCFAVYLVLPAIVMALELGVMAVRIAWAGSARCRSRRVIEWAGLVPVAPRAGPVRRACVCLLTRHRAPGWSHGWAVFCEWLAGHHPDARRGTSGRPGRGARHPATAAPARRALGRPGLPPGPASGASASVLGGPRRLRSSPPHEPEASPSACAPRSAHARRVCGSPPRSAPRPRTPTSRAKARSSLRRPRSSPHRRGQPRVTWKRHQGSSHSAGPRPNHRAPGRWRARFHRDTLSR